MDFKFRKYQSDAIASCMLYLNGPSDKPGIVVMATGSGKSWIIAGIAKKWAGPIIVLQPSKELLKQNFGKFEELGGTATIYSASAGSKEISHVTYGTIGSIKKAVDDIKKLGPVLLIVDECHFGVPPEPTSQFMKFVKAIKPAKSIGLTATPFRLAQSPNGAVLKMLNRTRPGYYKHFIHVMQIQEIIDLGYWAESENVVWNYDTSGLRFNSSGSDFTDASVMKANKHNNVNNNVYLQTMNMLKSGERKSILVFCDSVATVMKMVEVIPDSGYVTGGMPKKLRDDTVEDFKAGKLKVLFNYGTLTTGFDHPPLDCVILARPMGSMAQFYQVYGRGCRISPGKNDFLFVDACGTLQRLAHPRELSIENCPYNGWSVYSGDRLMTGVVLAEGMSITRNDIKERQERKARGEADPEIMDKKLQQRFKSGKFAGKTYLQVAEIAPHYLTFLIENNDEAKYGTARTKLFQRALKTVQLNQTAN